MNIVGRQYERDDKFKAQARSHQSEFRATELKVGFNEYGNRLTEKDAENLLAYYEELGVREILRARYPKFSQKRDGDLLRSEHIVFNLIAPLAARPDLCIDICNQVFGVKLASLDGVDFEYSPQPKSAYLDDATAFDAYIHGRNMAGTEVGIGIEVKYTERSYPLGRKEAACLRDPNSPYWQVSNKSRIYIDGSRESLVSDELRQIWRNHMLGLSMKLAGVVGEFHSVTLYPEGNTHIAKAVDKYASLLINDAAKYAKKVSYEAFIDALHGGDEIKRWQAYLRRRYLVSPVA